MEVDDVVDLSMGRDSLTATVRDLQALTQNAGLTITPAPPSAVSNGIFQDVFYFIISGAVRDGLGMGMHRFRCKPHISH